MNVSLKKESKKLEKTIKKLQREETKMAETKVEETKKKPINKKKTPIAEQDPKVRAHNFSEVSLGYTMEQALAEAERCMQCKKPLCREGCPVNIDIKSFITLLKDKKFKEAIDKIKETNALPAVCGRVCPQETQCESKCTLGKIKDSEPVSIGRMERFLADWERNSCDIKCEDLTKKIPKKGIKIAVIGAGPASLTVASEMAKNGYEVTIYEAFQSSGGVLRYGIPEFRLPKAIVDSETEYVKRLGVKIIYNMVIGKILTVEELFEMEYKAIFIGVGAGVPTMIDIPGKELIGVFSANEFLTRSNLMTAYKFPDYGTPIGTFKRVGVFGGGNVAMDSARTALRLGAEKVTVYYRRTEEEMPARREEYHHAVQEGIEFAFLTNPTKFLGENYQLKSVELQKCELGEPDKSGRRSPVPIACSEFKVDLDAAIIAVGTQANPVMTKATKGLKLTKWGYIEVDPETQMTSIPGVFAGGDIVTGSATVISAMGAGKKATQAMIKYLTK
jgi:glutamate synthase (NADPH/NADH) small chain